MDIFEFMRCQLNLIYISDLRYLSRSILEEALANLPESLFSEEEINKVRAYAYTPI